MRAHRVHYQPKTVVVWSLDGQRVKGEPSTGVTPLRSIKPCQPHGRIQGEVGGVFGLGFILVLLQGPPQSGDKTPPSRGGQYR